MRRRPPVVVLLLAACVLAACAPGRNDELRSLVDDIAPAQKETVGCEWESTWGGSEKVKSYYGCAWVVPGTIARVGRPLVSRAVAHGFTVYCRGADNEFEVIAARGKKGLAMQVLARDPERSTISAGPEEIPRGHVLVRIGAARFESRAPEGAGDERCVA